MTTDSEKICRLIVRDQVNVKLDGLDPMLRRRLSEELKFLVPYARHMPSFKLGRWDGKVGFFTPGGQTYYNLLDRILPTIINEGYEIVVEDRRPEHIFTFPEVSEQMFAHKVWPEGHPRAGEPIVLMDHQARATEAFITNLQSVQCIATGAGKTLLSAALSSICEPYGRTLLIVPNRSLVEQTEEDYRNLGLDVGVVYGGRHEYGHTHTISTWQSLVSVIKKKKASTTVDIAALVEGVVCVMIDEAHTLTGQELKDMMGGPLAHIPIRWAFTGTIPKEEFQALALTISVGPIVGEVRAKELQDKGILANCEISILQLIEDHIAFAEYHDEHDFLCTDPTRMKWIAAFTEEISQTGNVLILVDRIATGKLLETLIPNGIFISGNTKTKDRRTEYKSITEGGDKILIATAGIAAVGISITHINHLVFISYGKSFQKVIQSTGRGLRKGGDKEIVYIWDICSTMRFDKKHLTERKKFYKEAEYPFSLTKVSYL